MIPLLFFGDRAGWHAPYPPLTEIDVCCYYYHLFQLSPDLLTLVMTELMVFFNSVDLLILLCGGNYDLTTTWWWHWHSTLTLLLVLTGTNIYLPVPLPMIIMIFILWSEHLFNDDDDDVEEERWRYSPTCHPPLPTLSPLSLPLPPHLPHPYYTYICSLVLYCSGDWCDVYIHLQWCTLLLHDTF